MYASMRYAVHLPYAEAPLGLESVELTFVNHIQFLAISKCPTENLEELSECVPAELLKLHQAWRHGWDLW